jgi:transposase-like protein
MSKKKFNAITPEFKSETLKLVSEQGMSVSQAAQRHNAPYCAQQSSPLRNSAHQNGTKRQRHTDLPLPYFRARRTRNDGAVTCKVNTQQE